MNLHHGYVMIMLHYDCVILLYCINNNNNNNNNNIVVQRTKDAASTIRVSGVGTFDNLLRKGIDTICNLSLTDIQWLQASLPVKDGGQGVRRVLRWHLLLIYSFCLNNRHTPATAVISQLDHWDHWCFSVHGQGRMVGSLRHRLSHRSSSNQTVT